MKLHRNIKLILPILLLLVIGFSIQANLLEKFNVALNKGQANVSESIPEPTIIEKVVEVPVEKIVTRTIQVDNPALLNQIATLQQENQELRDKSTQGYNNLSNYLSSTEFNNALADLCEQSWSPVVQGWKDIANQCISSLETAINQRYQYTAPQSPSTCFWTYLSDGGYSTCY